MGAFWESFDSATEVAVDVMGEPITVNGVPGVGVVSALKISEDASTAGVRKNMDFEILVSELVLAVEGQQVIARGITAAIYQIEYISGTLRVLHCGPENRWDGL